ncbi:MAG: acyltransferase family protein [Pseudomonadota bacterium]
MKYRPEIDGLRSIAVIPVILFHAGFAPFAGGFVGVDVFFVISGYLITSIILGEIEQGRFSLVNFYERRARRILPALFFVLLVSLPFSWAYLGPGDMRDFAQSVFGVVTFSSNILFWLESGYFDTAAELKPLLHTWSLAVEEQFYILFPLILIAAWRFGRRFVIWTLVLIFVVSLVYSHWAALNTPAAAFFLLPARGWELMIGALAAFYLGRKNTDYGLPGAANEALSLIGLLLIALAIAAYDESTPFPGLYALLPTAGTALIILCAREGTLVSRFLSMRLLVGIGLLSYSAYLWHQPLFVFARHRSLEEPSTLLMLGLCVFTFALAYISWRFVETPFRQRQRFTRARVFSQSVIGIVAFAAFGVAGDVSDGFRNRLSQDYLDRVAMLQVGQRARNDAVRNGICHFSERGKHRQIGAFLAHWDCSPSGATLLVFGDSHSADKAVALRENGVEFVQVTGAGCQLVPSYVTNDRLYCHDLFELVDNQGPVATITLANEFPERDISAAYLAEIFAYWENRAEQIYVFTPMPDFQLPFNQYLKFGGASMPPSHHRMHLFHEALDNVEIPDNVTIVETRDILCPDDLDTCHNVFNPAPLMLDDGHMSVAGAQQFGARLIGSGKIPNLTFD